MICRKDGRSRSAAHDLPHPMHLIRRLQGADVIRLILEMEKSQLAQFPIMGMGSREDFW